MSIMVHYIFVLTTNVDGNPKNIIINVIIGNRILNVNYKLKIEIMYLIYLFLHYNMYYFVLILILKYIYI